MNTKEKVIFKDIYLSNASKDLIQSVICENETNRLLNILERIHEPTYIHSLSVANMMAEYATYLDSSIEKSRSLVRASLLHDIGKICTAKAILNSEAKLSDKEWREMKRHPVNGFKIYSNLYDDDGGEAILLHHFLQKNTYPDINEINFSSNSGGTVLNNQILSSEHLIPLTVFDEIDSMFPNIKSVHADSIRKYSNRNYSPAALPEMVRDNLSTERIGIDGSNHLDRCLKFAANILSRFNAA